MPFDWTDGIKIGSVVATVSAGIAVQANRIKALFKKTDRHQETLFGKDKEGGLVSDVNVINQKIDNLDKKQDTQQADITWIRNHLQNNKK